MQLTLATRGSELALAQARAVALALGHHGCECELAVISTTGDRNLTDPLAQIGGKGLFTKEVDAAVLDHRARVAVHSLKDMPVEDEAGLTLAAVPERCSDRDVLVLNLALTGVPGWKQIISGALARQNTPQEHDQSLRTVLEALMQQQTPIGCGSPRRQAQMRELAPMLPLSPLRGNIATRLRKMQENNWGGVVMAEAALQRLELARTTPYLALPFLPAAGQGALGLRARSRDPETLAALRTINHEPSRQRALAERAFLQAIGGGCHIPAGIRTLIVRERMYLQAALYRPRTGGGHEIRQLEADAPATEAEAAGRRLGEELSGAQPS